MNEARRAARDGREIAVTVACRDWTQALPRARALVRRTVCAALDGAAWPDQAVEVSVVLADNAMSARLNRRYRRKRGPTNVLSFVAEDPTPASAGPRILGDIVIAHGVCAREARRGGKSLANHLRHLVVHGVLHLVGYDHLTMKQALLMERLEVSVLAQLRVANPYLRHAASDRSAR